MKPRELTIQLNSLGYIEEIDRHDTDEIKIGEKVHVREVLVDDLHAFLITQDNLEQVWKDIHKNNYWQYFKPFIEEIKKRYS